ncbi:hypothetical protein BC941DRAFT_477049 [Chlamydoabsidia padenii]|nr:hypothetical protein BC941DRAFT_477049 [Chlamydoabsidia padenii]
MTFVRFIQLSQLKSLTNTDLDQMDNDLWHWNYQLQSMLDRRIIDHKFSTPNHHYMQHVTEAIRRLGPLAGYSTRCMERSIDLIVIQGSDCWDTDDSNDSDDEDGDERKGYTTLGGNQKALYTPTMQTWPISLRDFFLVHSSFFYDVEQITISDTCHHNNSRLKNTYISAKRYYI